MQDKKKIKCPYTALKKPCVEHECPKWTKLVMIDPQNGKDIDKWACSDTWLPIMLAEVSQKLVRMDATMESHRNRAAVDAENLQKTVENAENINIQINTKIAQLMDKIREQQEQQRMFQLGQSLPGNKLESGD
jgi:hypothetical protein